MGSEFKDRRMAELRDMYKAAISIQRTHVCFTLVDVHTQYARVYVCMYTVDVHALYTCIFVHVYCMCSHTVRTYVHAYIKLAYVNSVDTYAQTSPFALCVPPYDTLVLLMYICTYIVLALLMR